MVSHRRMNRNIDTAHAMVTDKSMCFEPQSYVCSDWYKITLFYIMNCDQMLYIYVYIYIYYT